MFEEISRHFETFWVYFEKNLKTFGVKLTKNVNKF